MGDKLTEKGWEKRDEDRFTDKGRKKSMGKSEGSEEAQRMQPLHKFLASPLLYILISCSVTLSQKTQLVYCIGHFNEDILTYKCEDHSFLLTTKK